ncbi:polysaccharide biosynthesis C-terminal domain-containing protein [Enterococcus faecium]|uniref:polysaccharide biosynthesis C-terminal domain-containing protein n=1 Tax=Enterococcus faecium TaxID=1352 RepID=UPI002955D3B1|nr:polysaccharide biosynthesis C-terminal domain-containing protein [Enterococcus faecium]MDV7750675.1 polysaccharide biosynthesis C-terminal domain-containing protein [Enterococcus faecium]
MTRSTKLKLNTVTSLLYQIVSLICGFVLPRLILQYYGSEVNGLLSSITQFLAMITLCECGVGAVVQSALYKPIAQNDEEEISRIYVSAKKFFNKIALVLAIYICFLIVLFPVMNSSYSFAYTAILIVAISISSFAQYYFGIVYKLIINAAQLVYVQMIVGTATLLLNVLVCSVLMMSGVSIQIVKITTSLIFLLQPFTYWLCIKRKFNINKKITYNEEPIKQKWNGFFQHIATVVLENTDVIVLTTLSTLSNVSIYAVYHLVTNGIKLAFVSLTTGMKSLLGDMYARSERDNLLMTFSRFEWVIHASVTYVYTVAAILIVPFVSVYTSSIIDANYIQPLFGYMMCFAMMVYMIRIPYNYMILAAGHYKQTQISALVEAGLNIAVSIALVYKFGLVGVAFGTFVAMAYRTVYFAIYLRNNIINRPFRFFIKHILCDLTVIITMILSTNWITMVGNGYFGWIILACKVAMICLVECIIINAVFYRNETKNMFVRLIRRGSKNGK